MASMVYKQGLDHLETDEGTQIMQNELQKTKNRLRELLSQKRELRRAKGRSASRQVAPDGRTFHDGSLPPDDLFKVYNPIDKILNDIKEAKQKYRELKGE